MDTKNHLLFYLERGRDGMKKIEGSRAKKVLRAKEVSLMDDLIWINYVQQFDQRAFFGIRLTDCQLIDLINELIKSMASHVCQITSSCHKLA